MSDVVRYLLRSDQSLIVIGSGSRDLIRILSGYMTSSKEPHDADPRRPPPDQTRQERRFRFRPRFRICVAALMGVLESKGAASISTVLGVSVWKPTAVRTDSMTRN